MKPRLLAVTAVAAAAMLGHSARAQGLALFGEARLGLGTTSTTTGGRVDDDGETPDDLPNAEDDALSFGATCVSLDSLAAGRFRRQRS